MIAGYPASGKSEYAKTIPNAIVIDDPRKTEDVIVSTCNPEITTLVITDPYFTSGLVRDMATGVIKELYPDTEIEWKFFEDNKDQCLDNAKLRPDKLVDLFIESLHYDLPEGVETIPVWKPST